MAEKVIRFLSAMQYAGWSLVRDGDEVVWQLGSGGRVESLGSAWEFWAETGNTPTPF